MVQVVENRADIEGVVVSVRPDDARPGGHLATLSVSTVVPVEGYSNLFAEAAGKTLDVILPESAGKPSNVGSRIRCRIRRTGPLSVFVDRCVPLG